jgi:hypothetical protein
MGRPCQKPSFLGALDEGWSLPVVLSPFVQRDWRRHRAKGSIFAFAPTGNDATMITKMELVEGELGRFAMIRGEEPT